MEENVKQTEAENKEGFMTKVKNGLGKFLKGAKNFAVKTGRVNSANCYGIIENIGDFLVYSDHALISAVGMDDVVFTSKNVLHTSFEGIGPIRKKKTTVKYHITLDDNVVFPEKVREKNDVNNLVAIISIDHERSRFLGKAQIGYGQSVRGMLPVVDCDIYGYEKCFVIAVNLEKQVGEKMEKYQESLQYPYTDISEFVENKNKTFSLKFNDGRSISQFTPANDKAREIINELKETM